MWLKWIRMKGSVQDSIVLNILNWAFFSPSLAPRRWIIYCNVSDQCEACTNEILLLPNVSIDYVFVKYIITKTTLPC